MIKRTGWGSAILTIPNNPTHTTIQNRARELWQADKKKGEIPRTDESFSDTSTTTPETYERHPEYYWNKAIEELISPFVRAIAEEAGDGIIFKPGIDPICPFEYWRYKNDFAFAKAQLVKDTLIIQGIGIAKMRRFNLHLEKDVDEALEFLRYLQRKTFETPKWLGSQQVDNTIILAEITKGYPTTRLSDDIV